MSDFETELSELQRAAEEKTAPFSQAGTIRDPSLNQLRDQIKKIMIPLLIRTFQLKLEHNQAQSMPSRLQNNKVQRSSEEILEQLQQLDKDIKMLQLWCQSCHSQIHKAMLIPEEEQMSPIAPGDPSGTHAAASKSFSNAVSLQSSLFQDPPQKDPVPEISEPPMPHGQKKWWRSLLKKW